MVWYNPMTWFSSSEETPLETPMPMASSQPTTPMGPYGGKKRKTRRAKKHGKRHAKTGKAHRA